MVIIIAVYIPPDANIAVALYKLSKVIGKYQHGYPDAVLVVAGDFNQANLKSVLPGL